MMEDLINKTIKYVEKFFEDDYSGHDFYHTLRVYNLSKRIAENEKCDKEILYLTALLHDVDDYKLVGKDAKKFKYIYNLYSHDNTQYFSNFF